MITTFERGKIAGKLEGKMEGKIEGMLELVLDLLQAKFAPLPPEAVQRVAAMDGEQLRKVSVALLKVESLRELHLQD